MGEFFLTFVIFVGVIAVTAVLFGGWVVVVTARLLGRLLSALLGHHDQTATRAAESRPCPRVRCQASNPIGAKFCRRCGRSLELGSVIDYDDEPRALSA